jgi:outer membrane protein W
MRFSTTQPLRFIPFFVAAVTVFAALSTPHAAKADVSLQTESGDIRIGGFYIYDNTTRNYIATVIPAIGVDYTLESLPGTYRTNLGVDYMDRSSNGTQLQDIPVTISEQYYHKIGGTGFTPYGEAGVGAYFVKLSEASNPNLVSVHSETSIGGFVGLGLDISSSVFLDARYHIVSNIQGQNPSGIEFTAGVRF